MNRGIVQGVVIREKTFCAIETIPPHPRPERLRSILRDYRQSTRVELKKQGRPTWPRSSGSSLRQNP
jgi:hypothetical protein